MFQEFHIDKIGRWWFKVVSVVSLRGSVCKILFSEEVSRVAFYDTHIVAGRGMGAFCAVEDVTHLDEEAGTFFVKFDICMFYPEFIAVASRQVYPFYVSEGVGVCVQSPVLVVAVCVEFFLRFFCVIA